MSTPLRLVIDTDPGVDDAHAIMMAAAHPDATIEALTTVAGNVSLDKTTANACIILDALGLDDTSVYAGADRALIATNPNASHVHGDDGLGDTGFAPSERKVSDEHAVHALIRMADEEPGELTLVAIGPLTNLALATRLHPDLPQKYKKLVVMGGAIRGTGNTPNPSTEYNIYSDPEAAAIVFDAWSGLTLISWETTMAHPFLYDQLQALTSKGTPLSDFYQRVSQKTIDFSKEVLGRDVLFGADPLAMAVVLEPDIVEKAEQHHISVELAGNHTRGQTTVDWFDRWEKEANVNIILEVNRDRHWALMEAAVK